MLSAIQEKLGALVNSTWAHDMEAHAKLVKLYRDYTDGFHRAHMTKQMRKMLRISSDQTDQINLNYCDMVIQSQAERLTVTSIQAGAENDAVAEAATAWGQDILNWNRFDALQMDVHEAELRDGVTYVLCAYDNDRQMPIFAHELAYDGTEGLIAVYDRTHSRVVAAVKIFLDGERKRVNLYYPDRIEKYDSTDGQLKIMGEEAVLEWDETVGVPVVPFVNRGKRRAMMGTSEIAAVIPLQDALNRTLVSMLMTGELTAFQIKIAQGFTPPDDVTPGMWITIVDGDNAGLPRDRVFDAKVLEQGQLVPFISQAQFLIEQISTVSRTPLPLLLGTSNVSGETLKQMESPLIGKVNGAQVRAGNSWEDLMGMAQRVQAAYGREQPPAAERWTTQWQPAASRNETMTIDNALKLREIVGDRETLRQLGVVYNYDNDKIAALLEEREQQASAQLAQLAGNVPGIGALQLPELAGL